MKVKNQFEYLYDNESLRLLGNKVMIASSLQAVSYFSFESVNFDYFIFSFHGM